MQTQKFFQKYDCTIRKSSIFASLALAGWLILGEDARNFNNRKSALEGSLNQDPIAVYDPCIPQEALQEQNLYFESANEHLSSQRQEAHRQRLPQQDYGITDLSQDSEENLLARLIFGEARGCSENERIAVGYTVINRLQRPRRFGRTLHEVVLRPWQYSCFNSNDPNIVQLMHPLQYDFRSFEECREAARGILSGTSPNQTQGATHYFNPRSASPSWAARMTRIGRVHNSEHVFYREE